MTYNNKQWLLIINEVKKWNKQLMVANNNWVILAVLFIKNNCTFSVNENKQITSKNIKKQK